MLEPLLLRLFRFLHETTRERDKTYSILFPSPASNLILLIFTLAVLHPQ